MVEEEKEDDGREGSHPYRFRLSPARGNKFVGGLTVVLLLCLMKD